MNNQLLAKESQVYLFGNLFPHSISLCFSSRRDGNMSFAHGDTTGTFHNRERFLQESRIDLQHLVCAQQVHGDAVFCVAAADAGRGARSHEGAVPDTDALITGVRRIPLAVFAADCLPVFLYDAQKQVIGLVHAGWRGTKENIVGKTIHAMMKQYGSSPDDIYAGFGPAIRSCCYEVGAEFADRFRHGLVHRDGRQYLDLVRINTEQLRRRDIKQANIFDCAICTSCLNDEYFSYRREGASCGRSMAVLMIR
jgi:polyphenol oxidase